MHKRSPTGPMTARIPKMPQQITCGGFTGHLNIACIDRKALFVEPRKRSLAQLAFSVEARDRFR